MTAFYRRNLIRLAVAVVVASWTAGCGGGNKGGGSQPSSTDGVPSPDSTVIVTQFVLDSGTLSASDVDPGVVVDGVVRDGAQFTTWYATRTANMLLSGKSKVLLSSEAGKVTTAISSMGKRPSPNTVHSTALGILAQELVDANLIDAKTLGGAVGSAGKVSPDSALNAWYSAHQNDMLSDSASVTYSTEVSRIVAVLQNAPS